jgi:hypothetical protein
MTRTNATTGTQALTEFVQSIEATGGVISTPKGHVPTADEDWLDLGEAYMAACAVLGRKPVIQKTEPTNQQRAARALAALTAFKAVENETLSSNIADDITDLLTDLHHYVLSLEGSTHGIIERFPVDSSDVTECVDNMLGVAARHFTTEMDSKEYQS